MNLKLIALIGLACTSLNANAQLYTNPPPVLLGASTNWVVKWESKIETNAPDWKTAALTDGRLYQIGFPVLNNYCYTRSKSNGVPVVYTNIDSTSNIWMTMSNLPLRMKEIVTKTNAQGQVTKEVK